MRGSLAPLLLLAGTIAWQPPLLRPASAETAPGGVPVLVPAHPAPMLAPPPSVPAQPAAPSQAVQPTAVPQAAPLPPVGVATVPEAIKLSQEPQPSFAPATLAQTRQAIERYTALVQAGGWPLVPNDVTLVKAGERSPAFRTLRLRLAASGDLAIEGRPADTMDEGLAAAIRRFQHRHNLEETGTIGPRTLMALNVTAEQRLRQLSASAGRIASSKFPFGERYVTVNIPSQSVEAVANGTVVHRYVAVVGKPDRASPQVETRITAVNFNPTWTVPVSLIKKDIIPHVRKEPGYLARLKIRLFDKEGREVDPGTIDWSTDSAANYTVRQDSGADNSLGEVRIDMPNRHAVYMHDTPSKRLFARSRRFQSSGCVRVSGVKDFAAWILEGTAGPANGRWTAEAIDSAIASGKRIDARPQKPIPVAWVYLTGYALPDGTVHFRDDVYGLDEPKPAAPAPGPAPDMKAPTIEALVTGSIARTR